MKEIKLFNRDGADLRLSFVEEIMPFISRWELTVDRKHDYVLHYCRMICEYDEKTKTTDWSTIISIDPSGGPFISLGDEFKNKYKIVKINGVKDIWISERD